MRKSLNLVTKMPKLPTLHWSVCLSDNFWINQWSEFGGVAIFLTDQWQSDMSWRSICENLFENNYYFQYFWVFLLLIK